MTDTNKLGLKIRQLREMREMTLEQLAEQSQCPVDLLRQIEAGGELMLMGYPVEFTQVLPGEGATATQMVIVLGDLDLGAYLGTRRTVSVRTLTELYAANDQIGVLN